MDFVRNKSRFAGETPKISSISKYQDNLIKVL
jgi:hypothetical protein